MEVTLLLTTGEKRKDGFGVNQVEEQAIPQCGSCVRKGLGMMDQDTEVAGENGVWDVQGQEAEAKNQTVGYDFASCGGFCTSLFKMGRLHTAKGCLHWWVDQRTFLSVRRTVHTSVGSWEAPT